jgi:alpha-tubulin suppressor-like RCC1 family protein
VKAIAAGSDHSLALKSDGSVLAWGCGFDYGQCTVPAGALSGVIAIAAGYSQSLALKSDGSVLAWGCLSSADFGQCTVPARALSGVIAIAAGSYHSLALKSDGSVVAWGCGSGLDFGQCTVPAAAMGGVTAIAAGFYHSLAIDTAPTAATVGAFSALRSSSGTWLRWRTTSETQTLGFNLYRQQRGKLVKLNHTLIPSVFGGARRGHAYSFLDRAGRRGAKDVYHLQAVALDGARAWLGKAAARR